MLSLYCRSIMAKIKSARQRNTLQKEKLHKTQRYRVHTQRERARIERKAEETAHEREDERRVHSVERSSMGTLSYFWTHNCKELPSVK